MKEARYLALRQQAELTPQYGALALKSWQSRLADEFAKPAKLRTNLFNCAGGCSRRDNDCRVGPVLGLQGPQRRDPAADDPGAHRAGRVLGDLLT